MNKPRFYIANVHGFKSHFRKEKGEYFYPDKVKGKATWVMTHLCPSRIETLVEIAQISAEEALATEGDRI